MSCATHRFATSADAAGPGDGPASAQVGFNQQLRIALRGHIRHSDVLPYAGASALNMAGPQWVYAIFHGSSPLSTMNPEQSRRVDAALDQLRSLQRPNPHQPVLLDTRGSTARVAHLEETVATPEIKPPDEEFDEIGQDPVRHLLRPFALHE